MTQYGSQHIYVEETVGNRIQSDPQLHPFKYHLRRRIQRPIEIERKLTGDRTDLADFASGHECVSTKI